jgi:CBS domain-containing protein
MRLKQILEAKERRGQTALLTTSPDATILDAIRLLCQHRIGALLVVDEEKHLVGIVTERDVLKACCKDHTTVDRIAVREIMSRDVIVGHPDDTNESALQAMTSKRVRHLPVVEGDAVVGVLSLGDILRLLYREDELKIRCLGEYMGGTYGLKVY